MGGEILSIKGNKMKTFLRLNRGFTLLEILVALLILSGGLVGLVALQTQLISNAALSKQRVEATMLAQKKVEEFRSFISTDAYDAYFATSNPVSGTVSVQGETATFTVGWTATDVNNATAGRYANVVISVSWVDAKGAAHSSRIESSFSRVSRPTNIAHSVAGGGATPSCAGNVPVSWVVDNTTCTSTIVTGAAVGDNRLVSATTNSGMNQYVCTNGGTWAAVATYAKTCVQTCAAATKTWSGPNGEGCASAIAPGQEGTSVSLTDTTDPVTGSANFVCSAGTWTASGTPTCSAACAQSTVSWGNLTQCKDKTLAAGTSLNSTTLNFSSGTVTATASYRCENNGAWSTTGSTCTDSAATTSCPETVKSWVVNGITCSATAPQTNNGSSVTLTRSTGSTIGSASFVCTNGVWGSASSATCQNNCFVTISGKLSADAASIGYSSDNGSTYTSINAYCTLSNKSYVCNSVPVTSGQTYLLKASKGNGQESSEKRPTLEVVACGSSYPNKDLD